MAIVGCILGFAVLIYLSCKDWSIYLAAFVAACVVIFFSGMPFMETLSTTFITGMSASLKSFFFLLLSATWKLFCIARVVLVTVSQPLSCAS